MNIPARLCPVNGYDQSGLEQWLERMAAKGWRFGGTAGPLVFFDRCAPAQARVRLEPTRVHTGEADEELNELYHDLFCGGEFAVRDYGGLAQSLDFWLSDDTGEESYREAVKRFKAKWFKRTPKNRLEFYRDKLQQYCDKMKEEL